MKITQKQVALIIAFFLIYIVWGSTYFFIGVALKGFPPFLLGALRFTFAGLILLIICSFRKERIFKKTLVWRSAISGIILLFVDMAVIMIAQQYVSSSIVAIVASSTAIWIMLFDIPMWKRNFGSRQSVIGIIVGFLGVGMLYLEQVNIKKDIFDSEYGILLLIVGCISWSLGTLYAKYYSSKTEQVYGFAGSAWQMFSASLMFWIFSIFFEDKQEFDFWAVPTTSWIALVYLISFGSILAYSAYVWLLKVRTATEVATHAYINPIVAIIIGVGIGSEKVSMIQLLGLVIILLSVMLVKRNIALHRLTKKQ